MNVCMFPACVNGCRGHEARVLTQPQPYTTHVYSGPSKHGALLQHVIDRGSMPRKITPHKRDANPYKGMRKALRMSFSFKGQASRSLS